MLRRLDIVYAVLAGLTIFFGMFGLHLYQFYQVATI